MSGDHICCDISATPSPLTQEEILAFVPNKTVLDVSPITGGLSTANLYKVTTPSSTYAIRHTSGIFGAAQIKQEFSILTQAAQAGCSPKVYYASPEKGIIVMEYVDNELKPGRNINILNNISSSTEKLANLIRTAHQSINIEPYYSVRNPLDYIRYSAKQIPTDFLDKHDQSLLDSILNTPYPSGTAVISHNDFRSSNVLYNNKRFWLVDWELSGINHAFYDIAYLANYQDMSSSEGNHLLELYLQVQPSKQQCNDFNYFRRVAYAFSATLALPGLAADNVDTKRENTLSINSVAELWILIDDDKLSFDDPDDEYQISLFLLRQAASI